MNFTCPSCGKLLDAQKGINRQLDEPPVGANMICFYCETILVVGPETLTVATEDYLKSLDFFCRVELDAAIQIIKSAKQRMRQ